ncbi:MAG: putative Ig domain-containing protein [Blastococcus sp.]
MTGSVAFRHGRACLVALVAALLCVLAGVIAPATAGAVATTDTQALITSGEPDPIVYGQPYSFQFTASGSPTPTFRRVDGTFPYGLDMDSSGLLSGTTTQLGDFPVTIGASNGVNNFEDQKTYTLHVTGTAPQFNDTAPDAVVNTNYAWTPDTTGSNPPPIFSLVSGTLPHGLQVFANGIFGFPDVIGPGTPVTIKASNGVSPDATLTFTIDVTPQPPSITGTAPATGTVGTYYIYRYTVHGTPSATTSFSGDIPPGMQTDEFGELYGTPTTPGSYTYTVTATNGTPPDATLTATLVISGPPVGISGTPPSGGVGEPYSFAFTTTGAPTPTVTSSAGALPPGLTLSSAGVLSGTPRTAGTYAFTVRADNGVDPAQTEDVTVRIDPRPTVSVLNSSVLEGNSGLRSMTFAVLLSRGSSVPVSVHWATADGTAKAGSDYLSRSGTVTFFPGQTFLTISVLVRGDRVREPNETFFIGLRSPVHANLPGYRAVGTIRNDD